MNQQINIQINAYDKDRLSSMQIQLMTVFEIYEDKTQHEQN